MKLTKQDPYVTPDMIELTDGLRAYIADMVEENLRGVIEVNYASHFAVCIDEANPGKIEVNLGDEGEIQFFLTLDDIVDATLTTQENPELLDGLADELERLAAIVRSAAKAL